jgi:2-oxo-4-hydroxy-4-carboxy--5-ureidoimidazoline (OHCU) decarboxylase
VNTDQQVFAALNAHPELAGKVFAAGRESQPAREFVNYIKISETELDNFLNLRCKWLESRFQVNCIALTEAVSAALAKHVRAAIELAFENLEYATYEAVLSSGESALGARYIDFLIITQKE